VQQLTGQLAVAMKQLGAEKESKNIEAKQKQIDEYKAVTERLKLILPLMPEIAQAQMGREMMMAEHTTTLDMLQKSHEAELLHMAPQPPEPANGGEAEAA
jgi:hypothetical protein